MGNPGGLDKCVFVLLRFALEADSWNGYFVVHVDGLVRKRKPTGVGRGIKGAREITNQSLKQQDNFCQKWFILDEGTFFLGDVK